ncbi:hypothetical protein [Thalassomonas sp. RHCl1]|uniref:hypothetical protein n=1 Tax=Thalassomonas sp. RHCl1 TaxID=2995320 RepID=UPI00248AAE97|nr:hypothetical protein [Thalassomonas sp. RHCl1]
MYIIVGCFFVLFGLKAVLLDSSIFIGLIFIFIGGLIFVFKPNQNSKSDALAELGDGDGGD